MSKFILPNDSQRLSVVGMTGSGKTMAALFHLSKKDLASKRWVVFDFKLDDHIANIDRKQVIDLGYVPKKPGLYVVQPHPSQQEEVNNYLWKLWEETNIGIYADEGYMIPNPVRRNAFNACLTQGRSLRIPMIVLSQRPVWMSRFVFSEADFMQVFKLADMDDYQSCQRFIPRAQAVVSDPLPKYHSYYRNIPNDTTIKLGPVPDEATILDEIDSKLRPYRRAI